MKRILNIILAASLLIGLGACGEKEPDSTYKLSVADSNKNLSFEAADNSDRTIDVTAENVTWEISVGDDTWIQASKSSDGKKLVVNVDDYSDEAEDRSGKITLSANQKSVADVVINVTQKKNVLVKKIAVDKESLEFPGADYEEIVITVTLENIDGDFDFTIENTGMMNRWLSVTKEENKLKVIPFGKNQTGEDKNDKITISVEDPDVDDVVIPVVQKSAPLSSLTDDLALGTMPNLYILRQSPTDDSECSNWVITMTSEGLTYDKVTEEFTGTGNALKLYVRGEVAEATPALNSYTANEETSPKTFWPGGIGGQIAGSFYYSYEDGVESITTRAPLSSGTITVSKNENNYYTYTVAAKDDADNNITATATTDLPVMTFLPSEPGDSYCFGPGVDSKTRYVYDLNYITYGGAQKVDINVFFPAEDVTDPEIVPDGEWPYSPDEADLVTNMIRYTTPSATYRCTEGMVYNKKLQSGYYSVFFYATMYLDGDDNKTPVGYLMVKYVGLMSVEVYTN